MQGNLPKDIPNDKIVELLTLCHDAGINFPIQSQVEKLISSTPITELSTLYNNLTPLIPYHTPFVIKRMVDSLALCKILPHKIDNCVHPYRTDFCRDTCTFTFVEPLSYAFWDQAYEALPRPLQSSIRKIAFNIP